MLDYVGIRRFHAGRISKDVGITEDWGERWNWHVLSAGRSRREQRKCSRRRRRAQTPAGSFHRGSALTLALSGGCRPSATGWRDMRTVGLAPSSAQADHPQSSSRSRRGRRDVKRSILRRVSGEFVQRHRERQCLTGQDVP